MLQGNTDDRSTANGSLTSSGKDPGSKYTVLKGNKLELVCYRITNLEVLHNGEIPGETKFLKSGLGKLNSSCHIVTGIIYLVGSDIFLKVNGLVKLNSQIAGLPDGSIVGVTLGPSLLGIDVSQVIKLGDTLGSATIMGVSSSRSKIDHKIVSATKLCIRKSNGQFVQVFLHQSSIVRGNSTVLGSNFQSENGNLVTGGRNTVNGNLNLHDTILDFLQGSLCVEIGRSNGTGLVIFLFLNDELEALVGSYFKVAEVCIGRVDMIGNNRGRIHVHSVGTGFVDLFLSIAVLTLKVLGNILEALVAETLDTVNIHLGDEYKALEVGQAVDSGGEINAISVFTEDAQRTVNRIVNSGDSGLGADDSPILGLYAILVPISIFTDCPDSTVSPVGTIGSVLSISSNGFVVGLYAVLIPVAIFADCPDSTVGAIFTIFTIGTIGTVGTVLTILTIGTVLTIGNGVRAIVGGDLNTASNGGDACNHITGLDRTFKARKLALQRVNSGGQVFQVLAEILAGHSTCKAGDNGGTCEDKFEMLVHNVLIS